MHPANETTGVKPDPTEATAFAYLRALRAGYKLPEKASLSLNADDGPFRYSIYFYDYNGMGSICGVGNTIEEAVAAFCGKYVTGAALAQQKRDQAAQLLREADQLESEVAA